MSPTLRTHPDFDFGYLFTNQQQTPGPSDSCCAPTRQRNFLWFNFRRITQSRTSKQLLLGTKNRRLINTKKTAAARNNKPAFGQHQQALIRSYEAPGSNTAAVVKFRFLSRPSAKGKQRSSIPNSFPSLALFTISDGRSNDTTRTVFPDHVRTWCSRYRAASPHVHLIIPSFKGHQGQTFTFITPQSQGRFQVLSKISMPPARSIGEKVTCDVTTSNLEIREMSSPRGIPESGIPS